MSRKTLLASLLSLVVCVGCLDNGPIQKPTNPNNPNNPNTPNTPDVKVGTVPASAIFSVIAEDIEGSRISDTIELSKIVVTLFRDGRLDRPGFDKFTAAFPTAATKQRALTPDDAKTLRGL